MSVVLDAVAAIRRRGMRDSSHQELDMALHTAALPELGSLQWPRGEPRLRVLTHNVWAIPFIGKRLDDRMPEFVARIARSDYDVIILQEAWHASDRDPIIAAARTAGLPYAHVFQHGVGVFLWPQSGSTGLCIMSRFPFIDVGFHRFGSNGKPAKFSHMDFYGGKGVGIARILTPSGPVDLYATHLHACYGSHQRHRDWDEYKPTRVAQGFELASFIRRTRRSPLAILAGDLNSPPHDQVLDLLRDHARLVDAFAYVHPRRKGYTFNSVDNTWGLYSCAPVPGGGDGTGGDGEPSPEQLAVGREPPKRIDFLLFSTGDAVPLDSAVAVAAAAATAVAEPLQRLRADSDPQLQGPGALGVWRCVGADTVCWRAAATGLSVSDHNGVYAEFAVSPMAPAERHRAAIGALPLLPALASERHAMPSLCSAYLLLGVATPRHTSPAHSGGDSPASVQAAAPPDPPAPSASPAAPEQEPSASALADAELRALAAAEAVIGVGLQEVAERRAAHNRLALLAFAALLLLGLALTGRGQALLAALARAPAPLPPALRAPWEWLARAALAALAACGGWLMALAAATAVVHLLQASFFVADEWRAMRGVVLQLRVATRCAEMMRAAHALFPAAAQPAPPRALRAVTPGAVGAGFAAGLPSGIALRAGAAAAAAAAAAR